MCKSLITGLSFSETIDALSKKLNPPDSCGIQLESNGNVLEDRQGIEGEDTALVEKPTEKKKKKRKREKEFDGDVANNSEKESDDIVTPAPKKKSLKVK